MMRNTFYSPLPSELFSTGNDEFRVVNLEVTSLMDSKMHSNGFCFQPLGSLFTADNTWLKGGDHFDFADRPILDLQTGYVYLTSTPSIPLLPIKKIPTLPPVDAASKTRKRRLEAGLIPGEDSGESPSSGDWKQRKRRRAVQCSSQCHQQSKDFSAGIPQRNVQSPIRRSQKIGDKITALQKLVSPYGKTDTASVLQEASLYIKLLQEQIKNLFQMTSNSHSNISDAQHQVFSETRVDRECGDLRSRGLCLVPISSVRESPACGGGARDCCSLFMTWGKR
ncbi:hypothetical protein MLD38_024162 [Melastoma candidum]|uniref:Uncharacterized protein n=1 Tax=Melastoma candidum TaxID=119954 RepID=A0ACB9NSS8_9MYRT|nr:hypothetical protein MLD38_024162 [Melastoma candidum]